MSETMTSHYYPRTSKPEYNLMTLPLEIRRKIYHLVIEEPTGRTKIFHEMGLKNNPCQSSCYRAFLPKSPILIVCKQTYTELVDLLYGELRHAVMARLWPERIPKTQNFTTNLSLLHNLADPHRIRNLTFSLWMPGNFILSMENLNNIISYIRQFPKLERVEIMCVDYCSGRERCQTSIPLNAPADRMAPMARQYLEKSFGPLMMQVETMNDIRIHICGEPAQPEKHTEYFSASTFLGPRPRELDLSCFKDGSGKWWRRNENSSGRFV